MKKLVADTSLPSLPFSPHQPLVSVKLMSTHVPSFGSKQKHKGSASASSSRALEKVQTKTDDLDDGAGLNTAEDILCQSGVENDTDVHYHEPLSDFTPNDGDTLLHEEFTWPVWHLNSTTESVTLEYFMFHMPILKSEKKPESLVPVHDGYTPGSDQQESSAAASSLECLVNSSDKSIVHLNAGKKPIVANVPPKTKWWGMLTLSGAIHTPHIDADGLCTTMHLHVWLQGAGCPDWTIEDCLKNSPWEVIVIPPGGILPLAHHSPLWVASSLPAGTMDFAFTPELAGSQTHGAVVCGSNFYCWSHLANTLHTLCALHLTGHAITNAEHHAKWSLLAQMMLDVSWDLEMGCNLEHQPQDVATLLVLILCHQYFGIDSKADVTLITCMQLAVIHAQAVLENVKAHAPDIYQSWQVQNSQLSEWIDIEDDQTKLERERRITLLDPGAAWYHPWECWVELPLKSGGKSPALQGLPNLSPWRPGTWVELPPSGGGKGPSLKHSSLSVQEHWVELPLDSGGKGPVLPRLPSPNPWKSGTWVELPPSGGGKGPSQFFLTIIGLTSWLGQDQIMGEQGIATLLEIPPPLLEPLHQDEMLVHSMTHGGRVQDCHKCRDHEQEKPQALSQNTLFSGLQYPGPAC
ncbi:hypothetical protein BS47DRAFT_1362778 [Hydnum rufescens UP504]|uniref:Uncharacterized protein n=1 Tax=Hydnum rufescens UP504 TaxID=1448309 RepID=A0A9P6AW32_9AGAM|nr:hypothetical protein BS47DRAFT_1362778 [Hydnum rufescens UP504]